MVLSVLRRPGAARRYATVAAVAAVLVSLPAVVAALPVHARARPVAALLAAALRSADTPYSGYAESSGRLDLPDVEGVTSATSLLGDTTRMRAWWAAADRYRIDTVTSLGEKDLARDGDTAWQWDSTRTTATVVIGQRRVRLPDVSDALPPVVAGRLLADVPAAEVHAAPARRIAGRAADGLEVLPHDGSLVARLDVWVDPASGLPLRVEVTPVGGRSPAFTASFLELRLAAPPPEHTQFVPPRDAVVQTQLQVDEDQERFVRLPATLAGLALRSDVDTFTPFGQTDAATYGSGLGLVAVYPMFPEVAGRLRGELDGPSNPPVHFGFGDASVVETPLLNGLVVVTEQGAGYVLAGAVPLATLASVAAELVASPPSVRDFS